MIDLAPGQDLGERFVLVRRVAEGRAAQVWLAEDQTHERRVALKIVESRLLDAPAAEARLRAEMEAARSLPARLVVAPRALHLADGLMLLEMEYLPGGDLGQFRGRSFAVFSAALEEVAEALAAAHERGMVHRDLKCANVLLDADGRARLADFGLSTLAGATREGGSPYNMSPQQIRGEPASPADDLYAFGAMLYELLTGHPPYYPDISADRVLHEPMPPLIPRLPAPDRLRQLAMRLLSKSAADRPASMQEVRRELAAAREEESAENEIDAAVVGEPGRPAPPRAAPAGPGRRWPGVVVALSLLVLALLVFLWLPGHVARRAGPTGEQALSEALDEAERRKQVEEGRQAQAAARGEADKARERFAARLAETESRAAAVWATSALAAVREAGNDAAQLFELRRFAAARDTWDGAVAALEAIDGGRAEALAAALAQGGRALERGQSEDATEAFELALTIDPEDAAAQRGLERAGRLDEVLALVDEGAREEQAGRFTQALAAFRSALAIDAEAPGAEAAVRRITRRQSDDAFAATMSRGMEALAAGRNEEARAAFERARSMRPGSAEVKDALRQLEGARRAGELQSLSERARAAERDERWEDARSAWSEALSLESALALASEGLARVTPRVQLDDSIDVLLDEPERLWTQAGRAAAQSALAAAADAAPPRERLAQRASRLAAMVRAAETPVQVRLQSDGVTEVVIYRVGRMGRFETRSLELMPGRYAVVGTRPGFRDVREEVVIRPGQAPEPIVVRCEEPI